MGDEVTSEVAKPKAATPVEAELQKPAGIESGETDGTKPRGTDPVELLKEQAPAPAQKLRPISAEELAAQLKRTGNGADQKTVETPAAKDASDKTSPDRLRVGTPVEDFVKTEPVRAEMFRERTSWENTVGAAGKKTEWAEPGDWKVYEKDGKNWYVVKGEQFLKTYVPNPGFHLPKDHATSELPADKASQFIKLGITKAQKLPEGEWKVGNFAGKGGDYLLEDWQGKQYIIPKGEFEALYSPVKASAGETETLRLPKAKEGSKPVARPDLGPGVTSQEWEKGQIIRYPDQQKISVTNIEARTESIYDVNKQLPEHLQNRLIVKHERVGQHLVTHSIKYDLAQRLASTEKAQKILDALYAPGSKYLELEKTAMGLPNTIDAEYEKAYDASPEGQKETRAQLRERLVAEAIKTLTEPDAKTGARAKRVGFEDPHFRPRLDLVIGLPAAGKSTYIDSLKRNFGSAEIESDLIKEKMPEFNLKPGDPEFERLKALGIDLKERNGLGATSLMQESNLINDRVLAHMMKEGYNVILPGVGLNKEWTEQFIKEARAKGYDVHLHIIDTMPTDAIESARYRYEKDGRYVNPRFIGTHGERPAQNFAYLAEKGVKEGWLEGAKKVWNQDFKGEIVESAARLGTHETNAFERKLSAAPPRPALADRLLRTLAELSVDKPAAGSVKELSRLTKDTVVVAGVPRARTEIESWLQKGVPEAELEKIAERLAVKGINTETSQALVEELSAMSKHAKGSAVEKFVSGLLEHGERIHKEAQAEKKAAADKNAGRVGILVALLAVAAAAAEYSGIRQDVQEKVKSKLKEFELSK